MGTFCGSNQPGLIHTSLDQLKIQFKSDHSVAHNGFRMEWVVDGCGGILRKDSATFSSPNYPNVYPISVNYYFLKEKCFRKSHEIEIHLHIF